MIDRVKYEAMLAEKITPRFVAANAEINVPYLQGGDIREHLHGCNEIIIFAVTIGIQVDELINLTQLHDMSGAVILDELASEAVERLVDEVEADIKHKYKNVTTRFSPGYGDFPLEVQKNLLHALNAQKQIGLYVSGSNTLIPRKSVTAVIGVKV